MAYKVENAIIMAAGTACRFAPLSYEYPKALIEVKGEILIERQIRQLQMAGVKDIIVVVGYKKEHFFYLEEKFGVKLVENPDYLTRNNNASIYAVRQYLGNSYVCSSDNYFSENPFEAEVDDAYYAAVYSPDETKEWCITEDLSGYINSVQIGGEQGWFMLGHTFWTTEFSKCFIDILERIYEKPETAELLWESIFAEHLDQLKMKIRRYPDNIIFEFDTLDELRMFDESYCYDTRSKIMKTVSEKLQCKEQELLNVTAYKTEDNSAAGIRFILHGKRYQYDYSTKEIGEL